MGAEDEVMAVVVAAEGADPSPAELWEWCDQQVPAFAVPRFLKLVDELPMTPSGKLQKAPLREAGREGAHDRQAEAALRS